MTKKIEADTQLEAVIKYAAKNYPPRKYSELEERLHALRPYLIEARERDWSINALAKAIKATGEKASESTIKRALELIID